MCKKSSFMNIDLTFCINANDNKLSFNDSQGI